MRSDRKDHLERITLLKEKLSFLKGEDFEPARSGTHYKVFLSDGYVLRFRDDDPELLFREVELLKELEHPLIPKVLWSGKIGDSPVMVENRLPGANLDLVWKDLTDDHKDNVTGQIVCFLSYLRSQTRGHMYSVKTGKKYENFSDLLTDGKEEKIEKIKEFKVAREGLKKLLSVIDNRELIKLCSDPKEVTVVHGDLINHNLILEGNNLSGVIDWELALYGDPDLDLCRLFYYHECAQDYLEKGTDDSFEANFTDKLLEKIKRSELIKDSSDTFKKKYEFIRAAFLFDALFRATKSKDSKKNTREICELIQKSGINYI